MEFITDCRKQEGIETGLIDALITIARTLRAQGITYYPAVVEALKDLANDKDIAWLLEQAKELTK